MEGKNIYFQFHSLVSDERKSKLIIVKYLAKAVIGGVEMEQKI